MKGYNWPGNVRELKNVVESLLVLNKGKRVEKDMVLKQLKISNQTDNKNLPVLLDSDQDKLERELILKQLLYLRQDINEIKNLLLGTSKNSVSYEAPSNPALYLPSKASKKDSDIKEQDELKSIHDAKVYGINDDIIGELSISELEKEIIEKTLIKYKGNRRKAATALDISERTLYRKINEYNIITKRNKE